MQCKWCAGTYNECGCGYGHCAHCNGGTVTVPPFGPARYLQHEDWILTVEDFEHIINWEVDWKQRMRVFSDCISEKLGSAYRLTDAEVKMIDDYWNDAFRDETIGDVLQRVAMLIKSKTS